MNEEAHLRGFKSGICGELPTAPPTRLMHECFGETKESKARTEDWVRFMEGWREGYDARRVVSDRCRKQGVEDVLLEFRYLAGAEHKCGDGRALRLLDRYEPLVRAKLDGGQ